MHTERLIAELHRENLSTYFVLPLLKINKITFASEFNFKDSYLSRDGLDIFVCVNETTFFMSGVYINPNFKTTWKDASGNKYIQFSIPEQWHADVQLFMKGKYSRMSNEAKEMIRQHSGLKYKGKNENDQLTITDIRLLALDKCIKVKELWEDHFGVILDKEDELLSRPESQAFIDKSELFWEDA